MINTLHCKSIKEEQKVSNKMALLQEEIGDAPLAIIAKSAGRAGEWNQELALAVVPHSLSLSRIIAEADRFRLDTLKELMTILTPLQTVDLLYRHQEASHLNA